MDPQQFEPMSIGRILDKTFTIYKNNFVRFITIVALIQVPIALINLMFTPLMHGGVSQPVAETRDSGRIEGVSESGSRFDASGSPSGHPVAIISSTVVAVFLAIVGNMLCQAALTKSVSESYLNREISVGQAYRFVLPKLLTLIGASLLTGLVVGVGLLLLVVPGVIFSLWFYLTTPSIVVEGQGVLGGMSRSRALVSGNLGKVFLVGFLVTAITLVISMPLGTVSSIGAMFLWRDSPMVGAIVNQFANVISQVLAMPIGASAFILLYYDLRIRKEGFDLEMLAQSMSAERNAGDVTQSS